MYGNPYNFEDFFSQEKVFDISDINNIKQIDAYFYQNGNFIDGNGNKLEYKDEDFKYPDNLFLENF